MRDGSTVVKLAVDGKALDVLLLRRAWSSNDQLVPLDMRQPDGDRLEEWSPDERVRC